MRNISSVEHLPMGAEFPEGTSLRLRWHRLAAFACAGLLALSACAGLPREGEVHVVKPSPVAEGEIGFVARPPARGATPEQVVAGFLDATAAGFDDDFVVARQYLQGSVASSWDPLAQVRVYSDTQNVQASTTSSGAIRVSVGSLGTVSHEGVYSESSNEATITTDFSLARNAEGEWRIASLEDGIFLSEHLFSQLYVKAPVYYLASSADFLVADLHWYPRKTFPTQAVRALLSGPTDPLASAVTTAFPANTALVGSVDVKDGVALVNLSKEVLGASSNGQAHLMAQLRRTLTSLVTIQDVHVSVEGVALEEDSVDNLTPYPFGSYPLAVISQGVPAVVSASDGSTTPVTENHSVVSLGLRDLAVTYSDTSPIYAALSGDRNKLYTLNATSDPAQVVSGTTLLAPSFDTAGWVWTGETLAQGKLLVAEPRTGASGEVTAPWLTGMSIRSLAVSRDGARIAVVGETGGAVAVYLAGVGRDSAGKPVTLSDPVQIAQRLNDVSDIAWISATDLVVSGSTGAGGDYSLYNIQTGGPMTKISPPSGGIVSVTAGRNEQSIAVLTGNGTVMGRSGGAWRSIATGVSSAAYPG